MIRTLSYFPSQTARNSGPVMQAMLEAVRSHGIVPVENSWDADAVIIWSVLWAGRMEPNRQVYEHYKSQSKPVIVIDVGALYRGETWKIALNNINADGYYGHKDCLDWDRPRRLGISLAINLSRSPKIIIAAQHRLSLQTCNINLESWIQEQITNLRTATDRPIVIRPHPRSALQLLTLPPGVTVEQPLRINNTYDSYNLAFDCHAMVNYNSGPGIQAALAGTRPIVDKSSLAWPVSIQIENIEQNYIVDRDQWLVEICHSEYTLKEIQQGLWIQRLQL